MIPPLVMQDSSANPLSSDHPTRSNCSSGRIMDIIQVEITQHFHYQYKTSLNEQFVISAARGVAIKSTQKMFAKCCMGRDGWSFRPSGGINTQSHIRLCSDQKLRPTCSGTRLCFSFIHITFSHSNDIDFKYTLLNRKYKVAHRLYIICKVKQDTITKNLNYDNGSTVFCPACASSNG